jgi:hypothetical protein
VQALPLDRAGASALGPGWAETRTAARRGRSDPAAAAAQEEQQRLLADLRRDAARLCAEFGLQLRALDAEPPQVRVRYGICYSDGSIRIRLRHARSGRALRYSALVDTLCHELAHLRHFDHSPRFRAFYQRILERARALGIYRPTPRVRRSGGPTPESDGAVETAPRSAAQQLALFEKLDRPAPREVQQALEAKAASRAARSHA